MSPYSNHGRFSGRSQISVGLRTHVVLIENISRIFQAKEVLRAKNGHKEDVGGRSKFQKGGGWGAP